MKCTYVFFFFLLKAVRSRSNGYFQFGENSISLSQAKKIEIIPIEAIARIEFWDRMDETPSKAIFEFFIYQYDESKDLEIRLKEYGQSDKLIDQFLEHDLLKDKLKNIDGIVFSKFLTD